MDANPNAPPEDSNTRRTRIVDVSSVGLKALAQIASGDDSAFAKSMGYLLKDLERATEAISGWSSYLDIEQEVAGA